MFPQQQGKHTPRVPLPLLTSEALYLGQQLHVAAKSRNVHDSGDTNMNTALTGRAL